MLTTLWTLWYSVYQNPVNFEVLMTFSFLRYARSTEPFFLPWCNCPSGPRPPHYRGVMLTLRCTTLGRTPLDEWSVWHRDLYLTTHNTHKRQTSMPTAVFESTVPATEWPQTHALDRTTTGTSEIKLKTTYHFAVWCNMELCVWCFQTVCSLHVL